MSNDNKIKLSPRLRACAELVKHGARLADIGTDHAYLPIWLIQSGVISRAFASDINRGPLENARADAEKYGVSGSIEFLLADGLGGLCETDADTIVIAGMGGETIEKIITGANWHWGVEHSLILQPMSKQAELCRWLYENGFYIADERLVRDAGEIYRVMLVKRGKASMPGELELHAGRLKNDEVSREYLDKLINKFTRAKIGMESSEKRDAEQISGLAALIRAAEKRKKELDEK